MTNDLLKSNNGNSTTEVAKRFVEHSHILSYAEARVNLGRDDVKDYRDQVNFLRDRLGKYIDEHSDYALIKMLGSGSVMKGTALKTINDMDVAVYIRPADDNADETQLLYWLKDRLREVYPTMKDDQFVPQQHCVTVSFAGSGLDVDVVPVIYEDDKDDRGYLIVKDTGDRVLTSIPLHLEFLRKRKNAQPIHFAQVVRLVKWWVRKRKSENESFRFKSFMVELLCAHLADNGLDMSDYPLALQNFFTYIVTSNLGKRIYFGDYYNQTVLPKSSVSVIEVFDPVNPENNVSAKYSETDRRQIVEAAADALDALTEAHYATTKGRAIALWQEVFGSTFREI
jgi:tRNA nucleotidyltransferase (CCA-adding enzyme)